MEERKPRPATDSVARVVRDAFDREYYLDSVPDVARAGLDPVAHYLRYGSAQGISPHPNFDSRYYLHTNPDVGASRIDPFYHYLAYGRREGRRANEAGRPLDECRKDERRPEVSILIPAYRPDFLDLCIACALNQTFSDFEIIISDDSIGDVVGSIVSKWMDKRIRYRSNPTRQVLGANRDFLLQNARGKYVKFLFDDDMIFSNSIERLVQAARNEKAALSFHARYDVDDVGFVQKASISTPFGEDRVVSQDYFFQNSIGRAVNFIGEPSNVLIQADALSGIERPFYIDGRRMRFLADVALFANIADRDLGIAQVSYMGGAFRHHKSQNSDTESPHYSAGLFEWEYLLRWSADMGHLDDVAYIAGMARIIQEMYVPHAHRYPELHAFMQLAGRGECGKYLSEPYLEALDRAHAAVDERVEERFRSADT